MISIGDTLLHYKRPEIQKEIEGIIKCLPAEEPLSITGNTEIKNKQIKNIAYLLLK